ncbi:MAG TPA: di-trans,poly-cis-decaprenylcistransferase [Thermoanaerobaculia bacterium]|jgi:undecaprenyl diphosphate synthase|nr:di-trans,poly-cis-decaprenylcistransferase [Thermoanaerobaculia bacterium]
MSGPRRLDEPLRGAGSRGGLHAAIIMDGNGRWATARGRPRTAGHLAGADAVRRAVEAAPGLGVRTLTLFAFSADNWQRPDREVRALMGLFRRYLATEAARCAEKGVRISVIGRRDRLPPVLLQAIVDAEALTAGQRSFWLRIAVDYSARDAIVRAAGRSHGQEDLSRESFARLLAEPAQDAVPDVDLLIRTGGEKRLSDFLLWECAYAELVFTDRMWPDFTAADFAEAVRDFHARERRFGRVAVSRPEPLPAARAV